MIKKDKNAQGRNELCACGSGKKYKKCCEARKNFANQKINLTTMLKLLFCLVKGLKGQSVIITKDAVEDATKGDWMGKFKIVTGIHEGKECYVLSVKQKKKSPIIGASGRIILPGS